MAVYTDVSDADLTRFVAEYRIGDILSCKGIAEGVENSNYLLTTESGNYILTLYEKRVNPDDLPFFIGLMEHLAARGFSCPTPIRGQDGHSLRRLCGRPAAIISFLDGLWPRQILPFHCTGIGDILAQLHLRGVSASGVRLGVVLALFSFVGFESATSLGAEAVNPLRTIPRAVIQSAVFAGLFFVLCAYLETLGMHKLGQDLGKSTAPMSALADLAGLGVLGQFIDFGALVSMFACVLACMTAAARVLLRMAQDGLVHARVGTTHRRNATPHLAVLLTGICTAVLVAGLAARGVSGSDIYGWMGSLAVYGFITCYGLAAVALPVYLKRRHHLTMGTILLSVAAALAMLLALAGTLYPVPDAPYNWLPYLYLVYLVCGTGWFYLNRRRQLTVA